MAILSIGELLGMGGSADTAGLIPFSGLEYDASGYISGISGSAIGGAGGGGGIDPATCSAIASSYAESAASSKLNSSAFSSYTSTALDGHVPFSGLDYSGTIITGISGSAIGDGAPESTVSAIASSYAESAASSKVDTTAFDESCSSVNEALSGISSQVSAITGLTGDYIERDESGAFQPAGDYQTAGDYAYTSSLSGKLDNSASSTWYPMTGNPSSFLTSHQSLSGYVPNSSISAQSSVWNTVTDRQYASAMTGYIPTSESSKYQPKSSISAWTGQMKFISAKADNSAISSWSSNFVYKSAVSGWSGQVTSISAKQDKSGMTAYATTGSLSSKLDKSSINFNSNSSYVTGISGVPLSGAGGGGGGGTGNYVEKTATVVAIGSAVSAGACSLAQGVYSTATNFGLAQGMSVQVSGSSFGQGYGCGASSNSLAQGTYNKAVSNSFAQGHSNSASSYSIAQGLDCSGRAFSLAQGISSRASSYSIAQGASSHASSYSFAQGKSTDALEYGFSQGYDNYAYSGSLTQGSSNYANSYSLAQGNANSAKTYSFTQGLSNTASGYSFAQGNSNSAINTAVVFGKFNLRGNGNTSTGNSAAFAIGDGTASGARHDLLLVTKDGEIRTYSSTADTTGLPIIATLRAISAWATANGWAGM